MKHESSAFIACALVIASTAAQSSSMPCTRTEYARLKDSTRRELIAEYCGAKDRAAVNAQFNDAAREAFQSMLSSGNAAKANEFAQDSKEAGEAQASCLQQMEDAQSMLSKKFKTKAPPSCD